MVRVIGPALIDTALDHTAALSGIEEHEVIDLFAEAAVARGPLPPVRFGKNPYGVLPVVKLGNLTPLATDTDKQKTIESFVRNFALIVGFQAQGAAVNVPVIEPGDPDAADKLEAILKLNPVSRRLEVAEALSDDARALGCAYDERGASGRNVSRRPRTAAHPRPSGSYIRGHHLPASVQARASIAVESNDPHSRDSRPHERCHSQHARSSDGAGGTPRRS